MQIDLANTQKMILWLKDKLYLNSTSSSASRRSVKRGQVYQCNFGIGVGSEMQKNRPALIVQNNPANSHSGNTIVIPITHDTSSLPCVVNITPKVNDLGETILDGQANTSNIMCVSKARLGNFICTLQTYDMKLIDEAIAKSLDLMKYYAETHTKLDKKLLYLAEVKNQRNKAQDELNEIREYLLISENSPIIDAIKQLENC